MRGLLTGKEGPTAHIVLDGRGKGIAPEDVANFALGASLRGYKFKKYKSAKTTKKDGAAEKRQDAEEDRHPHRRSARRRPSSMAARALSPNGVTLARDLVNEPANVLGPAEFAQRAKALTKVGVEVTVLAPKALQRLGMNALLAVGQGSVRPSHVVVMQWKGAGAKGGDPVVFVGKGVTFDTGGISIKPAAGMEDMKGDMAGAACVVGLMHELAERKAKVNAVGIIGLVENMPSGTAQRPGDIVAAMSGTTIEVLNTDAEGRMVLADCLWYAQQRFKPKALINLATLTGAVMVALGKEHAGLFSNNNELAGSADRRRQRHGREIVAPAARTEIRQDDRLEGRRHQEHRRQMGRLDLRRAVPPALRQGRNAVGASRHRRHRDVVGRQRDQSQLGLWLRRASARPARARSLREALRPAMPRGADGPTLNPTHQ